MLLEQVNSEHANQLRRALARKQQAAYESRDLADSEARAALADVARRATGFAYTACQLKATRRRRATSIRLASDNTPIGRP